MRPWLVASGDFTSLGGMDRANLGLASFLARRGDRVRLVAHRVADELASLPGVETHLVPRPFGAHLIGAPLLARAAARQARALPPGARMLMNGGNGVAAAPTWIHYLHAAYEPHVAGSIRTRISASAGRRYYLRREAAALAASPLVICNSERTAHDVRTHYGVAASRIVVIYYGTDRAAFGTVAPEARAAARAGLGLETGRPMAIFIGALGDRRKGFDLIFEAWRTLSAGPGWDVDLLVAGAGAEQQAWTARARSAGLHERMRFLGFRTDVGTLLAAADVLVHPARYEAYGLGVHEAICRGVPAIVSGIAGVTERFTDDLRPLVLPDRPTAVDLAAALTGWRRDPDGWRRRLTTVSAQLRARSWDHMAADVARAVEEA